MTTIFFTSRFTTAYTRIVSLSNEFKYVTVQVEKVLDEIRTRWDQFH